MSSSSLWTADANEALSLSLGAYLPPRRLHRRAHRCASPVRAPEDKASLWSREVYEGFHPTFTYPVSHSPFFFSPRHEPLLPRYLARRRRSTATRTSLSKYATTHASLTATDLSLAQIRLRLTRPISQRPPLRTPSTLVSCRRDRRHNIQGHSARLLHRQTEIPRACRTRCRQLQTVRRENILILASRHATQQGKERRYLSSPLG